MNNTSTAVGSDPRGEEREPCQIEANIVFASTSTSVPCFIENISIMGAQIRIYDRKILPRRCSLLIPISQTVDQKRDCEIIWTTDDVAGVRFLN